MSLLLQCIVLLSSTTFFNQAYNNDPPYLNQASARPKISRPPSVQEPRNYVQVFFRKPHIPAEIGNKVIALYQDPDAVHGHRVATAGGKEGPFAVKRDASLSGRKRESGMGMGGSEDRMQRDIWTPIMHRARMQRGYPDGADSREHLDRVNREPFDTPDHRARDGRQLGYERSAVEQGRYTGGKGQSYVPDAKNRIRPHSLDQRRHRAYPPRSSLNLPDNHHQRPRSSEHQLDHIHRTPHSLNQLHHATRSHDQRSPHSLKQRHHGPLPANDGHISPNNQPHGYRSVEHHQPNHLHHVLHSHNQPLLRPLSLSEAPNSPNHRHLLEHDQPDPHPFDNPPNDRYSFGLQPHSFLNPSLMLDGDRERDEDSLEIFSRRPRTVINENQQPSTDDSEMRPPMISKNENADDETRPAYQPDSYPEIQREPKNSLWTSSIGDYIQDHASLEDRSPEVSNDKGLGEARANVDFVKNSGDLFNDHSEENHDLKNSKQVVSPEDTKALAFDKSSEHFFGDQSGEYDGSKLLKNIDTPEDAKELAFDKSLEHFFRDNPEENHGSKVSKNIGSSDGTKETVLDKISDDFFKNQSEDHRQSKDLRNPGPRNNNEALASEENSDDVFQEHHGFLDMGAYTNEKGSFGWYADFPVGKEHDKVTYSFSK